MEAHLRRLILGIGLMGLIGPMGCQTPHKSLATIQKPQQLIRTELYFAAIPLPEWDAFLEKEVTPRFPDGLSWFDVQGQWLGKSGRVVKLPSRVLVIIHSPTPEKDRSVDEIRDAFKTKYRQQSVLRASFAASTSF